MNTISGEDWKRELAIARATPNSISLQIKMKLNPSNPTPGIPTNQPPILPVTQRDMVDAMTEILKAIDSFAPQKLGPVTYESPTKAAWDKINNLRSRL